MLKCGRVKMFVHEIMCLIAGGPSEHNFGRHVSIPLKIVYSES
jgi:hypothetical protein